MFFIILGIAGEWDEDDFISLHEYGPTTEFSSPEPVTFEYTTSPNPTPDGKYLRGTLKLSLPFYGGLFYLQYQRVDVTIVPVVSTTSPGEVFEDVPLELEKSQSALVTRENIPLAKSSPFSITFSLQHRNRTCRANRGRGYSQLAATTNIDYLIEDLSNISTVMISVISIGCHFGKPTGWIESDHSGGIRLLLECDRSTTGKLQECDWISITIPSTRSYIWKDSYGVVEGDSESSPWGTRIVINIPYSSSSVTAVSSKPLESLSHDLSGLHCRVCDSFILDSSVISSLRPLPSGLFDQLMHEYLCSETPPTMPLSMAEYTSPSEEISVGHIYFSVHPNDILENSSLLFKCKLTPSLLDVLGGSFGMKLLPQVGLSDNSATLSLVDISTCGVSCSRCQTILGDGLIAVDAIETEHSSNEIHLNDLQDIRFLRSSVVWRSCGHEAEWGAKELVKLLTEPCNIEQVYSPLMFLNHG